MNKVEELLQKVKELEAKIKELQESPISDHLQKAAERYATECAGYNHDGTEKYQVIPEERDAFIAGANWRYSLLKTKTTPFVSKDFDEEFEDYCYKEIGEPWDGGINVGMFELLKLAEHFVNWQKAQDENRKKANITLANSPAKTDVEFETAFNDIWDDVENETESVKALSPKEREELRQAAHDWFESGKIWKERESADNAFDATIINDGYPTKFELNTYLSVFNTGDKVKIVLLKGEMPKK